VLEPLADRWHVVLPELRGHGDSGNSDHYSIWQFIYDQYRVIDALALPTPVVVGHSLGGQIASHHAAMFPEQVRALVIIEGLGPPERPRVDPRTTLRSGSSCCDDAAAETPPLPSAGSRSACRHNPRLSPNARSGSLNTAPRSPRTASAIGNSINASVRSG
jgi:pimeloyl-ACP methyl ester carboxylesterase